MQIVNILYNREKNTGNKYYTTRSLIVAYHENRECGGGYLEDVLELGLQAPEVTL